jgi:hypothetical protein
MVSFLSLHLGTILEAINNVVTKKINRQLKDQRGEE